MTYGSCFVTSVTCQPGHFENPTSFQEQDFTHFPGLVALLFASACPQAHSSRARFLHQEGTEHSGKGEIGGLVDRRGAPTKQADCVLTFCVFKMMFYRVSTLLLAANQMPKTCSEVTRLRF